MFDTAANLNEPVISISAETAADVPARDALLSRAMGPRWRKKSSEKLRRGRLPADGLALVARDRDGTVVGTVRLWNIDAGDKAALLLGPLAVDPAMKNGGIGSALIVAACETARNAGHGAVILVGDAPYYSRFGFSADKTANLAMPGPFEQHRLLAVELIGGWLDGACGILRATGLRAERKRTRLAA